MGCPNVPACLLSVRQPVCGLPLVEASLTYEVAHMLHSYSPQMGPSQPTTHLLSPPKNVVQLQSSSSSGEHRLPPKQSIHVVRKPDVLEGIQLCTAKKPSVCTRIPLPFLQYAQIDPANIGKNTESEIDVQLELCSRDQKKPQIRGCQLGRGTPCIKDLFVFL